LEKEQLKIFDKLRTYTAAAEVLLTWFEEVDKIKKDASMLIDGSTIAVAKR